MPESNTPDSKPPELSGHIIEIANETSDVVNERLIQTAVKCVVEEIDLTRCQISVAVVDDTTIHQLNRQYLAHDYPTDVLSFPLERDLENGVLSGEVIVSIETAAANSAEYDWSVSEELILYVIHGCLHLIGYDDHKEEDQAVMRSAESRILAKLGICQRGSDNRNPLKQGRDS